MRWGGPERYALDICRHFNDSGWSVSAYTPDARIIDSRFSAAGIHLRTAPLRGGLDIDTIRILTSDFKAERPGAIVHVHRFRDALTALIARRLSRRRDIRIVATCHRVRRGRHTLLAERIYSRLDAIIFPSECARRRFLAPWHTKAPSWGSHIHVVHPSILDIPSEEIPLPASGPTIAMFHGPIAPGKGLETLIDALPRLKGKRMRLYILGAGNPDYIDRLRQRAQMRGVMEMIDWMRISDDTDTPLRACHFGVTPSQTPEAFCLANLEYMAYGRPVITTDNGAQSEYITDGVEGFLVPNSDAGTIAELMDRLTADHPLAQQMGNAARAAATGRMAWQKSAEELEKIYLAP